MVQSAVCNLHRGACASNYLHVGRYSICLAFANKVSGYLQSLKAQGGDLLDREGAIIECHPVSPQQNPFYNLLIKSNKAFSAPPPPTYVHIHIHTPPFYPPTPGPPF